MKLPGYCTECRKFRYVTVTNQGMIAVAATGVANGVCNECERAEEKKRENARS